MSNDYELTMDYDMVVCLGKGSFKIIRYDFFYLYNVRLTCVRKLKGNMPVISMTM